jgi:hypothetical protein
MHPSLEKEGWQPLRLTGWSDCSAADPAAVRGATRSPMSAKRETIRGSAARFAEKLRFSVAILNNCLEARPPRLSCNALIFLY